MCVCVCGGRECVSVHVCEWLRVCVRDRHIRSAHIQCNLKIKIVPSHKHKK